MPKFDLSRITIDFEATICWMKPGIFADVLGCHLERIFMFTLFIFEHGRAYLLC
jgi:hypothetical protein